LRLGSLDLPSEAIQLAQGARLPKSGCEAREIGVLLALGPWDDHEPSSDPRLVSGVGLGPDEHVEVPDSAEAFFRGKEVAEEDPVGVPTQRLARVGRGSADFDDERVSVEAHRRGLLQFDARKDTKA